MAGERFQAIVDLARRVDPPRESWAKVAASLRREAECSLGPLSAADRYWIGTAWWAFHQPESHLHYPAWAPGTRLDPNLSLRHRDGGNCESSANGHVALLANLGIPSRAVYGRLMPEDEGHVWTISDVDGHPYLADVHLARATDRQRRVEEPWLPSSAQVMTRSSYAQAQRFGEFHRPEIPVLDGLGRFSLPAEP